MTQMVPGPLYGYRNWTLREDGLLYSLNDGLAWTPGRITAAVCRKGHPAPVRGCSCGFYAYRSPTQNAQSRVALWGRVVGHRLGYRAEFAYPIELVVADRVEQSWLDRLTQHYGCVVVRESMVNAPAVVSGRPHELGRIIRAQEAARRFGVPKAYPDHVLPFQWFSRREVYQ